MSKRKKEEFKILEYANKLFDLSKPINVIKTKQKEKGERLNEK